MPRVILPRRTFLQGVVGGAAVSLGLPLLESMSPARAESKPPVRFGVWFWGNGIRPEHWIPKTTGTAWTAPEELVPLMGVRPYVNVITGLKIQTGDHAHHSGMTGILSGARFQKLGEVRDTVVSTFSQKSVDQVAADHIGAQTRYRSLELGVCRYRYSDEGTTFQHLSHNGPNNVNPAEYSPTALFRRLFSALPGPKENNARRSVLDAVTKQIGRLRNEVSVNDRRRLEQHTESIRSIEQRLSRVSMACTNLAMPRDYPDVMGKEQIEENNRAMSDLLALALACDLTRCFSVLFSTCGSGVIVWQAGATNSLHMISHDEPLPQPTVHRAVVFTMQQLAYFLQRLASTPEGGGNLLDSCAILATSEHCEGNIHSYTDFPILIAGRAGGKLKGGIHYRSAFPDNTSRAPLTVLRAAGCPIESFGYGPGRTDESITEIEA